MSNEYYYEKLNGANSFYFQIGTISCPALNNEKVHFERNGFRHLVRKGRKRRYIKDQLRRFKLLPNVTDVIKYGIKISYNKRISSNGIIVEFFTISLTKDGTRIKVIVRRINGGTLHFFSIMD